MQGRLLHPSSEFSTALWLEENSGVKNLIGGLNKVYGVGLRQSALDWWKVHEKVEDYLYKQIGNLLDFGNQRMLLNHNRHIGFSHRKHRKVTMFSM